MVRARSILMAFVVAVALFGIQGAAGAAGAAPPVYFGSAELLGTASSGYFGASVAADASGDTVVVGDPSKNAVYIFERPAAGWSGAPLREVATITDPSGYLYSTKWGYGGAPRTPQAADWFGLDVAISADGSTIAVSNPGNTTVLNRNELWVYEKPTGGWVTGQQPFSVFDDTTSANLGCFAHNELGAVMTLAPDGSWLAASALSCEGGAAYIDIFYLDGWTYQGSRYVDYPAEVLNPNLGGRHIRAMATDGSTLFVAPPGGTGNGNGVEAWNIDATVSVQGGDVTGPLFGCTSATLQPYFNLGICSQPDAFLVPSGVTPGAFASEDGGYTVAAGGGYVVFGSPVQNAAYVFKEPAGGFHGEVIGQTATLVPATTVSGQDFGETVAISSDGDEIAVAAPNATVDGHAGQGDVFVYREPQGGWQGGTSATTESQDFVASHGAAGDRLGFNENTGEMGMLAGEQTLAVAGGEVFASSPLKGNDHPVYAFSTEFPLTVTMAGGGSGTVGGESEAGSVDCTSACSTDLWRGEPLALTATPAFGSTFAGWSGGGCSGTGTCAVTASSATSVTATFTDTINQVVPNTALVADGGTYTGQLAVTGASSGLTFAETAGDTSDIVVSPSGAIRTASGLAPGTYQVFGADKDAAGDSGGWTFTLIVESPPTRVRAPSAPGAPTGLGATGGSGQATLTWAAPTVDGGSAITGYNVYEGAASGAESSTPLNGSTPVTGTSFTATGLANGTAYYFTVKAVNAVGVSAASNEASVTPAATVAGAPSNLSAQAGDAQVSLNWTAPSSNGGSAIMGYNIYEGTSSGGESTTAVATVGNTTTTYTANGLTNGQTYYFTVKAVNGVGTSAASTEASATPAATATAPGAIEDLSAALTPNPGQVSLGWSAPSDGGSAITTYNIYEGTTPGGESTTPVATVNYPATTYATPTNLTNGQTYYFTVKAVNGVGTSGASNEVSATPQGQ